MSRRDSHGRVIPELADYLTGLQVLAHLRHTGMDLVPNQWATTELGRAQRESEPDPDPESEPDPDPEMEPPTLAALDQVQAHNQDQREHLARVNVPWYEGQPGFITFDPGRDLDLDRPPDDGKSGSPDLRGSVDGDGPGAGRTDRAGAEQVGEPVPFEKRDPITEFLKNDPDDQWGEP